MNKINPNLKHIVFKACLVAVWTDSSMSSDEWRYLSHLTEVLAESEAERNALRELRLEDLNEGQVLGEVAQLEQQEKAYVFDTCLDILACDRRLGTQEMRFLGVLRKTCGIGIFSFISKRLTAQQRVKARLSLNRRIIALFAVLPMIASIIFASYLIYHRHLREVDISAKEICTGKKILVSTFEPDSAEKLKLQTGQEVFQHVRDSIVSVNAFLNNDPAGGGSGSVIGKDESGTVYVLTNRHVIHNSYTEKGKPGDRVTFEVQQFSGARFDAELDFYSRKHDIALLAVKGMEHYTEPLKLILKKNLQVGQPVYAIGSPLGYPHTFTAGVVSALRESYLQTDATLHYGSSGGPLMDQHGALCAVVTRGHITKDYHFALYSDIVFETLKERKKIARKSADKAKKNPVKQ